MRPAITSRENSLPTRRLALSPKLSRRAGFSRNPLIATASAAGSLGGTRTPVSPSTTTSGTPSTSRGDNRQAHRAGLDEGSAKRFLMGRQDKQVERLENIHHIAPQTEHVHPRRQGPVRRSGASGFRFAAHRRQ